MTTRRAFAMFSSYLLVNLLLASTAVASDSTFQVNYPKHYVGIDDQSVRFRTSGSSRDDLLCPAVCPSCPACPARPPCPSCPGRIPPGYKKHEGLGYYKMHYEKKTWEDAKAACEREGGYLVVLNSQKEANLASKFLAKHSLPNMHIGFFDVTQKRKYITVLDEPLTSTGYNVWAPGEPNGLGKQNCGAVYNNGKLDDIMCDYTCPFLCELFA